MANLTDNFGPSLSSRRHLDSQYTPMEKVKGPAKLSRLVIFPIGGSILEQVVISVVPFATEIFSIIVVSIDSTTERCGGFFSLLFF